MWLLQHSLSQHYDLRVKVIMSLSVEPYCWLQYQKNGPTNGLFILSNAIISQILKWSKFVISTMTHYAKPPPVVLASHMGACSYPSYFTFNPPPCLLLRRAPRVAQIIESLQSRGRPKDAPGFWLRDLWMEELSPLSLSLSLLLFV